MKSSWRKEIQCIERGGESQVKSQERREYFLVRVENVKLGENYGVVKYVLFVAEIVVYYKFCEKEAAGPLADEDEILKLHPWVA
jgi:hypothetical protein